MLKFLTHKLKTQSINEDTEKGEENHDSGTESDEEVEKSELCSVSVKAVRKCSISSSTIGSSMESPRLDQQDAHSSEEELEVINRNKSVDLDRTNVPLRAASVCLAEKRKWSQIGEAHCSKRYSPENEENMSQYGNLTPSSQGSSDEEVNTLLDGMSTPVQFRTSPPLEAVKPGGRQTLHKVRSLSPPPKLLHYEISPRKRSKHLRNAHMQRPYLDFEKMQQLKARQVTAWRHTGERSGELSVFCW